MLGTSEMDLEVMIGPEGVTEALFLRDYPRRQTEVIVNTKEDEISKTIVQTR